LETCGDLEDKGCQMISQKIPDDNREQRAKENLELRIEN